MNTREHLQRTDVAEEPGLCFVIMPFGVEMDSIYEAGIRPALESLGMHPLRIDESFRSVSIMGEILDSILRAEVIITDLTDRNPNVYYELGLAHAVKSNVVLITQRLDDVPFDVQGIRCFTYENTIPGARKLAQVLEKTIRAMRASPTPHAMELRQSQELMQKGFNAWLGTGDIILGWQDFLVIVRYIDELAVDDEHVGFLAHCAAYFGRHLARLARLAQDNNAAVRALASCVARTPMQRPAWRAAAMLEHCSPEVVRIQSEEVLGGGVLDEERRRLLAEIVPHGGVMAHLRSLVDDPRSPDLTRGKADEAIRQLSAEFSLRPSDGGSN